LSLDCAHRHPLMVSRLLEPLGREGSVVSTWIQLEFDCKAAAVTARSSLDQSCRHHAFGGASGSRLLTNRDIPPGADRPGPRQPAVRSWLAGREKQDGCYQLAFSWTPIWLSLSRSPNTPR